MFSLLVIFASVFGIYPESNDISLNSTATVTRVGILGFPKIKIERKPQRNNQTDFMKLMLEQKGGSTEERKAL